MSTCYRMFGNLPNMKQVAKALPSIGLELFKDDSGSLAITDGDNYLWLDDNDSIEFTTRYGQNDVEDILAALETEFDLECYSEYDEEFDEGFEEDEEDEEGPEYSD